MEKIFWEFSKAGGRRKGFNNPMLQHFDGSNYYLAREIIQNSIDARDDQKKPVEVVFEIEFLEPNAIPGSDQLKEAMNCCNNFWPKEKYKNLHAFFDRGISVLSQKKIPVLKISDYNTKGVEGEGFTPDSQWFSLVQSEGASAKEEGEGGSFGIGKGAPIMASELRTVFYLTVGPSKRMIFQGVSELVNYKKNGIEYDGCGFYGLEGQKSVRDSKLIDHHLWKNRKSRSGLDVFVVGYRYSDNWAAELIKSVLRNFWYAIFKNELNVKIDSKEINADNLEDYLTRFNEPDSDDIEPYGSPLQYYLAIKRGKYYEKQLDTLGKVGFYFLETDEYLNHVAMMRKSHMVILSRPFRFPGNFCGVFICDDKNGNLELRKMEPPAHDKWVPERNPEQGKKIFEQLTDFIRKSLADAKSIKKSEILEVPEMYKYLPDNEDGEAGNGKGQLDYSGQEGKEETSQQIQRSEVFAAPVTISPQKITVINRRIKGEDDVYPIPHPHGPKPRNKKPRKKNDADVKIRAFNSKVIGDEYEYTVILESSNNGKYNLNFYIVGDDFMDKLQLSRITKINNQDHAFANNSIKSVWIEKNKAIRFQVYIKSQFKNAIKIELDEVQ
ncbi:MAG TPA: hypothetical protein PLW44_03845 [Chitinophagales bacterium]|nr:hypothetical protein [Chitinophagales bacterium]